MSSGFARGWTKARERERERKAAAMSARSAATSAPRIVAPTAANLARTQPPTSSSSSSSSSGGGGSSNNGGGGSATAAVTTATTGHPPGVRAKVQRLRRELELEGSDEEVVRGATIALGLRSSDAGASIDARVDACIRELFGADIEATTDARAAHQGAASAPHTGRANSGTPASLIPQHSAGELGFQLQRQLSAFSHALGIRPAGAEVSSAPGRIPPPNVPQPRRQNV